MAGENETRVVMPQLGESIVEAVIVRWRVRPGDRVERGQILAEVETDKATSELPAPAAGTVAELLGAEGATIAVGTPILVLTTGDAPRAAPPAPANGGERLPSVHLAPRGVDARGGPVRSSPAVRRLARRFNVDIGAIAGSGRGGRVTRDDLLRELRATPSTPPPIPRAEATPFATVLPMPLEEPVQSRRAPAYRPPVYKPQPGDRVVPFSRRREQIAGHMVHSQHTAAHVFALAEIDMSRVMAAKNRDAAHAERSGVKLTFMPYVIAAVARALDEHPELNASVAGDALVLRAEKNIGVAVDTEEGLIVPVVRRADELGILGVARAVAELSERARQGKLTPADISGGSFTISNPGKDGNLYGVSIIRQPEVAILRIGSIVKRAVVREIEGEDAIVVRPMMYAALSYDHRVIDGRKGNAFLTRVSQLLSTQAPQL